MNVYDFDKTIYQNDSTYEFYMFCLKRHKKIIFHFPGLLSGFIKYYIFHIGNKTQFKEKMYEFLLECDTDKDVNEFWIQNKGKIKKWYLNQKKESDIIISASPEFLLKPICDELKVNLIASIVSPTTGKYTGLNCHNEEKVNRLKKYDGKFQIDKFYSDSYSDTPLALLSKEAFIVNGDNISNWDFNVHYEVHL